jgi:hypothetical protein
MSYEKLLDFSYFSSRASPYRLFSPASPIVEDMPLLIDLERVLFD